jgi:hypothetical protein
LELNYKKGTGRLKTAPFTVLFFYAPNSPHLFILQVKIPVMKLMKWMGAFSAVMLVIACFCTWVFIPSRDIVVSGIRSEGTNFGKPAYFHFLMVALYLFLHFKKTLWAKRLNLVVPALNMAWAIRNYLMVTMCRGGECPEIRVSIWLVVASSLLMLLAALFPDMGGRQAQDPGAKQV